MRQYSTFIFSGYSWNPSSGTIELRYSLDNEVNFIEKLTLTSFPRTDAPQVKLDAALFALHLIGGISYYKTCLPKNIEIRSGILSPKQAEFWNSVYENGLGEFFYKNGIDFHGLINFPSSQSPTSAPNPSPNSTSGPSPRILIPIGGGKDSIVTVECLRKTGAEITLFRIGSHPLIERLSKTARLPLLTINRALSPELFRLNEEGALNGHVPITAYLSFAAVLVSLLYDFDDVAMSNEKSANYGNVEYRGKTINHQWSKSQEFEEMFRKHVQSFITPEIEYYSALRTMTELEIVRAFVKYPQYFHCTTSCNANWRIVKERPQELWCGKCPKCAFVFALYAAFLPKNTLMEIFGNNLFDETALIQPYRALLGLEGCKPFDCVGTPEEIAEAFRLARKRGELNDAAAMKMFEKEVRLHP